MPAAFGKREINILILMNYSSRPDHFAARHPALFIARLLPRAGSPLTLQTSGGTCNQVDVSVLMQGFRLFSGKCPQLANGRPIIQARTERFLHVRAIINS